MPWIDAIPTDEIDDEDVTRWDRGGQTYAIFQSPDFTFFCTQGLCPQDGAHLAGGLVEDERVECPDHGGVFDYQTGAALTDPRLPALRTFATRVRDGRVEVLLPDQPIRSDA